MLSSRCFTVLLVSACVLGEADAAGLIHILPPDGTSAVFAVEQSGTQTISGQEFPVTSKRTVRVSLVGTQEVAGMKCRWVEIEVREELVVGEERMDHFECWKVLIPESSLVDDAQHGISKALRIYKTSEEDPREPRLITGKEERRGHLRTVGEYLPSRSH